ncbi:hypothetical protein KC640_01425 [Candidatus Dojkabacteria bacterium]|uniref:Uncharacterized protein n=1 Tax=Candidatus Dojkabacteria bacterium TaxID=2099670 RepID=A0A955L042_9BACT|nr:hypothetical protein [Candidatus Dojkabacteria bacterium]
MQKVYEMTELQVAERLQRLPTANRLFGTMKEDLGFSLRLLQADKHLQARLDSISRIILDTIHAEYQEVSATLPERTTILLRRGPHPLAALEVNVPNRQIDHESLIAFIGEIVNAAGICTVSYGWKAEV